MLEKAQGDESLVSGRKINFRVGGHRYRTMEVVPHFLKQEGWQEIVSILINGFCVFVK